VLPSTSSKVGILSVNVQYYMYAHGPDVGCCSVAIVAGTYLPVAVRAIIGDQDSPGERDVHEDVYKSKVL
jgi:hypothetical protein